MCRFDQDHEKSPTASSLNCPFTIRQLDGQTHLIREHDPYGETPHIYARTVSQTDQHGNIAQVIVINDTGVGTTSEYHDGSQSPARWSIRRFIDHHLNPDGQIPYLIILSHCHWDHILGLPSFLQSTKNVSQQATVLASSYEPSFTSSYQDLQEHSLCNANNKDTPVYNIAIWAADYEKILYNHPLGIKLQLPVMAIHTPGHTPDSLTWFDLETRRLYVGDSLYQQETSDSEHSPWGPEQLGPVMFTNEANLHDWWKSIDKLTDFVVKENLSNQPRVTLASGHVTASADAYSCLLNMKDFMGRVLREEVPCFPMGQNRGRHMAHWRMVDDGHKDPHEFSVGAPVFIIEDGRKTIPREAWACA